MSITKKELYEKLILIHKEYGQGLSGIVKVMGEESELISKYLDELIEEGLIICCDTGNTLGHPESNKFYMPTKGYNVWLDEGIDGKQNRHKGRYLHHVRYYLGKLADEDQKNRTDLSENDEALRKSLNPTSSEYLKDEERRKNYNEWLERNHDELKIMKNLSDSYEEITTI